MFLGDVGRVHHRAQGGAGGLALCAHHAAPPEDGSRPPGLPPQQGAEEPGDRQVCQGSLSSLHAPGLGSGLGYIPNFHSIVAARLREYHAVK